MGARVSKIFAAAWRGAGFAGADFLQPQSVFQFGAAQCAARFDRKRAVHAERRHAQYCRRFARAGNAEILLFAQHCRQPAANAGLAQRVRDMLEEITMASNGMVQLQIIDPEPFSEAEDQAVAQGLVARPVARARSFISA